MRAFIIKQGAVTDAIVRHYIKLNEFKKPPQFEYHRIEDLKFLEDSIKSQKASGQLGQRSNLKIHDHKLKVSSSKLDKTGRSSSLVRTLALRAKGRRFKSGSAHSIDYTYVCVNWIALIVFCRASSSG